MVDPCQQGNQKCLHPFKNKHSAHSSLWKYPEMVQQPSSIEYSWGKIKQTLNYRLPTLIQSYLVTYYVNGPIINLSRAAVNNPINVKENDISVEASGSSRMHSRCARTLLKQTCYKIASQSKLASQYGNFESNSERLGIACNSAIPSAIRSMTKQQPACLRFHTKNSATTLHFFNYRDNNFLHLLEINSEHFSPPCRWSRWCWLSLVS